MFKVGDKVKIVACDGRLGPHSFEIGEIVTLTERTTYYDREGMITFRAVGANDFACVNQDEIAYVEDQPKTWGEMTPEEKGALLLAKHEGKTIQTKWANESCWVDSNWVAFNCDTLQYRVKPEPVREIVTLYGVRS